MASLGSNEYPFVTWIIDGVLDFVSRQRRRLASSREIEALEPREVSSIARDLKLSKSTLRELAAQSGETDLLVRMLAALRKKMPRSGDALARDMQTVCSLCRSRARCNRELASRTAATNYRKFCPNAFNLDLLARNEPDYSRLLLGHHL